MEPPKNFNPPTADNPILTGLILGLLALLTYAGFLAYKSIQWDVLDKLEAQPLILPPPATSSAATTSPASPSTHSSHPSP